MPLITDLLQPDRVSLLPSTTQTAGGSTGPFSVGQYRELLLFLVVTAASGTGQQLNVFLDTSPDGGTTWVQAIQLGATNIAAAVTALQSMAAAGSSGAFGDTIRIRWTIAGTTPSFTFAVTAIGK